MRRALPTLLAAVFPLTPTYGAEPVTLSPSNQWNVDFAADNCRLIRVFGEGENRHYLAFVQYWPDETTGMTIAGPAFKHFRGNDLTAVRFFETQTPADTRPFMGTVEGFGDGIIYSSVMIDKVEKDSSQSNQPIKQGWPKLDTKLGEKARFIELRQASHTVRLETGPLDAAFKVMNECTMDLLREWGLDPERHQTAQSRPRWINRSKLVSRIQSDYPFKAGTRGEQGIMRMRVVVSAEGMVESCTIVKATRTERLESPACKVMERAQFEPGRDADGQPFRALYTTSITYMVP